MVKNLIVEVYFPSEKYQILSNLSNLVDYISQIISGRLDSNSTTFYFDCPLILLKSDFIKKRIY